MAFIQCPECSESLSDTASSCPHCGVPTPIERVAKTAITKEHGFDYILDGDGDISRVRIDGHNKPIGPKEKVAKTRIRMDPGYRYFVDGSGDVVRVKEPSPLPRRRMECPRCNESISDKASSCPHCGIIQRKIEKVAKTSIKKEPGFEYVLDADGDISRFRINGQNERIGAKEEKVCKVGLAERYRRGYRYFIDDDGDLARVAESSGHTQATKRKESKRATRPPIADKFPIEGSLNQTEQDRYAVLLEISKAWSNVRNLDQFLTIIVEITAKQLPTEDIVVFLRYPPEPGSEIRIVKSTGNIKSVILEKAILWAREMVNQGEPVFRYDYMCIPFFAKSNAQMMGGIYADSPKVIKEQDKEFLQSVATFAGMAIENAYLAEISRGSTTTARSTSVLRPVHVPTQRTGPLGIKIGQEKCPFCRDSFLAGAEIAVCKKCLGILHADCRKQLGKCGTYACSSSDYDLCVAKLE